MVEGIRLFDTQIDSVRRLLERGRLCGESMVEYDLAAQAFAHDGCNAAAPVGSFGSVLLKADTQIELGPPGYDSCAMVLPTSDVKKVVDGRVTHLGEDLPGLSGKHDFALVVIAGGVSLDEPDCAELSRALLAANRIDGFMARSAEGRFWCRVSREACERGLAVRHLGAAVYDLVRQRVPAAEAVELVIVVSLNWVVRELCAIRAEWEKVHRTLRKYRRVDGGAYECESSLACDDCPDSEVCDTIREIIVIRKGDRELRLRAEKRSQG